MGCWVAGVKGKEDLGKREDKWGKGNVGGKEGKGTKKDPNEKGELDGG